MTQMPPSPQAIQTARKRFVSWLRWFMDTHPAECPTQTKLAELLGVSGAAVTYLLQPNSTRVPSFETLLAAKDLLGFPVDVLLSNDPPAKPNNGKSSGRNG